MVSDTLPVPAGTRYQPRLRLRCGTLAGFYIAGAIPPVDLAQLCRDARRWPGARTSIGLAARQIRAPGLVARLAAALDSSGLPPGQLELDVSGWPPARPGVRTLLMLSAIRDLGVGLAVGAAEFSWANLRRLPLTTLKLDHSLVQELTANPEALAFARATIDTGHALGLTVVADAVETEAQRATLSGLGCDEGQGGLFGGAAQHDVACGARRSAPASGHAHPRRVHH